MFHPKQLEITLENIEKEKQQIKSIKEELLRLRCHEEFSKKFEALAQDYLRKKTNK